MTETLQVLWNGNFLNLRSSVNPNENKLKENHAYTHHKQTAGNQRLR